MPKPQPFERMFLFPEIRIFYDLLDPQHYDTVSYVPREQNIVRRVKSQIDLKFCREAYQECQQDHNICKERYELLLRLPEYMRLIDVASLKLVRAPPKCHYVTLSYVWGQVKSTPLPNPDSDVIDLREHMPNFPRTIQDTVEVVKAIGIRYLWVDDTCILETKQVSKVTQFGDMHKIYGNAQFTIIAVQGSNADEGLHGIRPNSRPAFHGGSSSQANDHMTLVNEVPIPGSLDRSIWMTRGWCLQEQLLSKAFLVFWDDQVYWQCPKSMSF